MATTSITVNVAESQNYLATSATISVSSSQTLTDITVVPSQNGRLPQTSSYQSPTWNDYNSSQLTIGGTTSGKNAGKYSATFTPKSAYQWSSSIQSQYHVSAQGSITVYWYIIGYGVYGIKWTSNVAKGTRTQDAVGLADPVPALGSGTGSSPFDYIYPWCDMNRVYIECSDFSYGGLIFVRIPKFWYKLTLTGNHYPDIEISATQKTGYSLSPAHRDRDGSGERDYVYVSSQLQNINGTMSDIRSILNSECGEYGFQIDYAMFITLFLLFTVEMAYTEAGACIGIGDGSGSVTNYHTGTSASSRTTSGRIMYRHIYWWTSPVPLDGIYTDGNNMYSIDNPKNYRAYNYSNGRLVGDLSQLSITSSFFNAIQTPYSNLDNYIILPYGGYVSNAKIFQHSSFNIALSGKRLFRVNPSPSDSYAKYGAIMFIDTIGSQQSLRYGKVSGFTPPNNYSRITDMEILG